jgi:hypothetical protein
MGSADFLHGITVCPGTTAGVGRIAKGDETSNNAQNLILMGYMISIFRGPPYDFRLRHGFFAQVL